jgi:hypothetical protein
MMTHLKYNLRILSPKFFFSKRLGGLKIEDFRGVYYPNLQTRLQAGLALGIQGKLKPNLPLLSPSGILSICVV